MGVTWEGLSLALQQAGVEENWAHDTEGLACAIGMVELAGKNPKVLEDLKTFSQEKPF